MFRSRPGPAFALTLLLPAALALSWAWIEHGGPLARAEANERASAERCRAAAAEFLNEHLASAAAAATCPLRLDDQRRVVGPFARALPTAPPPQPGLAECAAAARFAAGDAAAAREFFAHAANDGTLTPEGTLAYADLLAHDDLAAARRVLDAARARHATAFCGPLPFALLAALGEARWSIPPARRAELLAQAIGSARDVLPAALPPAIAALRETIAESADDPRLDELRAAAATASSYAATSAPAAPTPGPFDSMLVPLPDARLAVVPAPAVATARQHAALRAAAMYPEFRVDAAAFATTAAAPPTSALLAATARSCLGLALATFVLGNLLLWRLTRRELQLLRLRGDFIDIVSHELRTPLTALSLKAEMLAHGDVPEDRVADYVHALHGDVRRLTDQVERILDFGRLERGAPLRRVRTPARTVLARGLREGRPALRLVRQHLDVCAARVLPALDADVDVLGRALRNLLENAAKYAPPGSTIAVRAFADGRDLVVEVADTGPGVPAAERAAVFQPFVRASTASAAIPGSGLGLALVAAAAKAHGGRVEVADRPGGGAVFTLSLPIADAGARAGEAAS
ncbi:MAG: HAMP domain-containing sensor histidine kinase [Planctomycetota bacterium]